MTDANVVGDRESSGTYRRTFPPRSAFGLAFDSSSQLRVEILPSSS